MANVERVVEEIRGRGALYNARVRLADVEYRIRVHQRFYIAKAGFGTSSPEQVPGLRRYDIKIVPDDDINTLKLWNDRTIVTLHLADGRVIDVWFDGTTWRNSGELRRDE